MARLLRRAGLTAARCADRLDPRPPYYGNLLHPNTSSIEHGAASLQLVRPITTGRTSTVSIWVNGRPA